MKRKRLAAGIVEMSGVGPEDQVVEIGAGKGALTVHLAQKAKKVIAIENDLSFAKILREEMKPHRNVRVIEKDFLEVNLPDKPYSVVSNIPYSITTPILKRLMDRPENPFQNGLLVMEKGAAKRFTSQPSTNPRILAWRMYFDGKDHRPVSFCTASQGGFGRFVYQEKSPSLDSRPVSHFVF